MSELAHEIISMMKIDYDALEKKSDEEQILVLNNMLDKIQAKCMRAIQDA